MRRWYGCGLLASVAMLAGCSVVTDYPSRTHRAQMAFAGFDFGRSAAEFKDEETELDRLCYRLERGTVFHTAGRFDESNKVFELAFSDVEDFDNRATVNVRDTSSFLGTLVINEKTVPYRGESFERVYVHAFSAMNYLLKGDMAGARVEVKRAYNRQTKERLAHQEEYNEAMRQSQEYGVYNADAVAQARREYGGEEALETVDLFQDAFTFYLGSVVYEMLGEYNDALVEAKKVLVIRPDSLLARQQIVRLAKKAPELGRDEMVKAYGDLPLPASGEGEVVVLYACGLAPQKHEMFIALPIWSGRGWTYNKIAFPLYRPRPNPVAAARVSVGGRDLGQTEMLADVEYKARATLYQRMPVLVLKSLLRAGLRYGIQKGILDAGHPRDRPFRQLAALGVGVLGAAVEQADLRSWLTLPSSFQAARGAVPAGSQTLTFDMMGPGGFLAGRQSHTLEVQAGKITVVVVRSVGPNAVICSKTP